MPTAKKPLNILIIEDNPADVFVLETMLKSSPLNVEEIYSADRVEEAIRLLQLHQFDLVFLDLSLPDSFGVQSFLSIKQLVQFTPVIILSGLSESDTTMEVLQHGAEDYLVKGEFTIQLLLKSAEYSIERKKAEKKLITSEQNYKQLFYKNPFPSWIYDRANLSILEVNDAAIEKYGYTRNEFMEMDINQIDLEFQTESSGRGNFNNPLLQHWPEKLYVHRKKDGKVILMQITFYEISYSGRIAMQAQMNDVTEKIRLEEELAEQRAVKQREITEAVLKAQENERKGIGEELHDNINQILATSKLFLSCWMQDRGNSSLVEKSHNYILDAMAEIRKLSKRLITPDFVLTDLKMSIHDMIRNIMLANKMEINTDIDILDEIILNNELKLTMYRILQEQFSNILKHSDASVISIQINSFKKYISITISDNGKGFDPFNKRDGIGFINMQSRAALFNGHIEVESSPGKGCRLSVNLEIKSRKIEQAA